MSDADKIHLTIVSLRSVVGCFKSRTESSTCIEDHHPSCQAYLKWVLKTLEDKDNEEG